MRIRTKMIAHLIPFVTLMVMPLACASLTGNPDANETIKDAEGNTWQLIIEDDFAEDRGDWVWEGEGDYDVVIGEGRMALEPDNETYGGVNAWLKKPLPANFRAEFDYRPAKDVGQNLVFMFSANLMDGEDLIEKHAERNGHYVWITNGEGAFNYRAQVIEGKRIPPMSAYTLAYWATPATRRFAENANRMPLQKNPRNQEEAMLTAANVPTPEDEPWKPRSFVIQKIDGRITVWVDGEMTHEAEDPGGQKAVAITRLEDGTLEKEDVVLPVYGEGHFGFRTLHMWPKFSNYKVYELIEG